MDLAKNMLKMPSAKEVESPQSEAKWEKYNSQVPQQKPCLVNFDELKLSGMGSISSTPVGLRWGGRVLWEAQKMSFSQEAAEDEGNGVGNERNQILPEFHKNLSAHPAS